MTNAANDDHNPDGTTHGPAGGSAEGPSDAAGERRGPRGRTPTRAAWLSTKGPDSDVVISSRARLARNLSGFPFVHQASRQDRRQIVEACKHRIVQGELFPRLAWVDIDQSSDLERALLVERQLISKQLASGRGGAGGRGGGPDEPRGVAICLPDERASVMVAEEDHLRMQAIEPGFALAQAYQNADALDDALEAGLDYAFEPRFGYLTACPTNVGTGLRLSVMLHLPGLRLTGELDQAKRSAEDMGLAVRGFFGEGTETAGDLFQISNQTTLGRTEASLLTQLDEEIIPQVVEYERRARRTLLEKRRRSTEDTVFRALGLLRHARLLGVAESLEQLSLVRLGVTSGLIEDVELDAVHRVVLLTHKAHLQTTVGRGLDQQERRVERARMARQWLGGV